MWTEALNLARVPFASKWRKAENIYYPPDICEASATLMGPRVDVAPTPTAFKYPLPPRPLFFLLRSPKSLARLVTKARW